MLKEFFLDFMGNKIFWVAGLSWFIAQLIKVLIDLIRYKSINKALFISSGGMPSSHSSFVTSMSFSIGFTEGFGSALFALSAVLSMIVMYDAAGVRRAAGKQAAILNVLLNKIENHGIKIDKQLKELLGHSPIEVACGALLGIAVSIFFFVP